MAIFLYPQNSGVIRNTGDSSASEFKKSGKTYLVLIALDSYKNRLPLQGHVNDALQIKWNLYSKFNIDEVVELYDIDATKPNILKLVSELKSNLKADDALIFYYSGHGYNDKVAGDSFWIPFEGGINENLKEDWISTNFLSEEINNIRSNQILMIVDSCFNTKSSNFSLITKFDSLTEKVDNYVVNKSFINKKARHVICSGVEETSIGKSEFSTSIVDFIKKTDNVYFDSFMFFSDIKLKVKKTTPVIGNILKRNEKNDEDTAFIFIPRNEKIVINETAKKSEDDKKKTIQLEKNISNIEKVKKITKSGYGTSSLSLLNKFGLVLLPTFSTITVAGIAILCVDLIPVVNSLEIEMNEGNDYERYVRVYRTHIALFVSGVVMTSVGILGVGASIPMLVYKDNKKKLTFNINANTHDFGFDFRYNF